MASGIFSTTRVAGEGIALAIAMAILAGLVHASLARIVPHAGPATMARIAEASQRLTTGDLAQAAASLPQIGRHELVSSYTHAFTRLLHVLIAITLVSALASFAFLSRTGAKDDQSDESQRKVAQSAAV